MSWLDTLEQIRTRDFTKAKPDDRDKACRDVVNLCSYAAAMIAVVPLPFADVLLTLPIQSGMMLTVAHIHGRKLSQAQAKDLAMELGTLAGASLLAREGIKFILPVFGALLTVPAAFAANWAIGRVAMEYFKDPNVSKTRLRQLYADAIREGKSRFSKAEFDQFRKGNEKAVKKVVEKEKQARKKGAKAAKKAAPMTAAELIEQQLPKRLALKSEQARKLGKVVHVELTGDGGGTWTIDLSREKDWVKKGAHGRAAMVARATADDFIAVALGQVDPVAAVMEGTLTFEPLDVELAQAFGKLIA